MGCIWPYALYDTIIEDVTTNINTKAVTIMIG